jgi:hypothetical protein
VFYTYLDELQTWFEERAERRAQVKAGGEEPMGGTPMPQPST